MPHFPDALVGGADLHLLEPNTRWLPADSSPPAQQCGRCRLLFEGDPTLHPATRPDWWLCPPCRAILLGRNPQTQRRRPPPTRRPDALNTAARA
jgi:hypothetical protein